MVVCLARPCFAVSPSSSSSTNGHAIQAAKGTDRNRNAQVKGYWELICVSYSDGKHNWLGIVHVDRVMAEH